MIKKLDDGVIQERLRDLPGWSLQDGKLTREYHFPNFVDAFGFMHAGGRIGSRVR